MFWLPVSPGKWPGGSPVLQFFVWCLFYSIQRCGLQQAASSKQQESASSVSCPQPSRPRPFPSLFPPSRVADSRFDSVQALRKIWSPQTVFSSGPRAFARVAPEAWPRTHYTVCTVLYAAAAAAQTPRQNRSLSLSASVILSRHSLRVLSRAARGLPT
jgi:hypothetical protein